MEIPKPGIKSGPRRARDRSRTRILTGLGISKHTPPALLSRRLQIRLLQQKCDPLLFDAHDVAAVALGAGWNSKKFVGAVMDPATICKVRYEVIGYDPACSG